MGTSRIILGNHVKEYKIRTNEQINQREKGDKIHDTGQVKQKSRLN